MPSAKRVDEPSRSGASRKESYLHRYPSTIGALLETTTGGDFGSKINPVFDIFLLLHTPTVSPRARLELATDGRREI